MTFGEVSRVFFLRGTPIACISLGLWSPGDREALDGDIPLVSPLPTPGDRSLHSLGGGFQKWGLLLPLGERGQVPLENL